MGTPTLDLTTKSVAELRTMLDNAARVAGAPKVPAKRAADAEALRLAAQTELDRRGPASGSRTLREPAPDAVAVAEATARLQEAAARARAEHDLSPERAGTRTPHALLGKDGKPKLGGRARSKQVKRELYISYRNGDRVASLVFVTRDAEDPGSWEGGLQTLGEAAPATGRYVTDAAPEAAEAAFREALDEIAPRHA